MVYKNVAIDLKILRTRKLDDTTVSVYFERPIGFHYEAGDWIDINFYGERPRGGITYSLSSSPTESELAISFRVGISPFKKRLQSLQPGNRLYISQYGNDYGFHLNKNRSSVLIAGGIGIAPFRSMIKELSDSQISSNVQLVYFDKNHPFVFVDEIECWKSQLASLHVNYITTKDLSRKKRDTLLINTIDKKAHRFFIAGPSGMVDATEHLLIDSGVQVKDIRIDSFGGY